MGQCHPDTPTVRAETPIYFRSRQIIKLDSHKPLPPAGSAFEAFFTPNKPVVFNFHSYPWLIYLSIPKT